MISIRSAALRRFVGKRCFHTTQALKLDPKTVEEVKIPVPWGHIAGKWWGKKTIEPVIAVHGWQDNAGSWDPIAELMPDDFSILAVDLPGNGLSSHLPRFQNYYLIDTVGVLRRIKNHYGWDKIHLLGHSGGSAVCFTFAAVFPECVKSVFGIDFLIGSYNDEKSRAVNIGNIIDQKIRLSMRDHATSRDYPWEEAKKVWIDATFSSLDEKSAEIMMKRGVTKMPNGKYIFSRDHRLKGKDMVRFSVEEIYTLAKNISCHYRLVKATQSNFFDRGLQHNPDVLNIIEEKAKSYKLYEMDGNHHLHMDIPEKFVPLLVELLNEEQY